MNNARIIKQVIFILAQWVDGEKSAGQVVEQLADFFDENGIK